MTIERAERTKRSRRQRKRPSRLSLKGCGFLRCGAAQAGDPSGRKSKGNCPHRGEAAWPSQSLVADPVAASYRALSAVLGRGALAREPGIAKVAFQDGSEGTFEQPHSCKDRDRRARSRNAGHTGAPRSDAATARSNFRCRKKNELWVLCVSLQVHEMPRPMGGSDRNSGKFAWVAFFARCQFALTFGHLHLRTSASFPPWRPRQPTRRNGPTGAHVSSPCTTDPNRIAQDFCAVCNSHSVATPRGLRSPPRPPPFATRDDSGPLVSRCEAGSLSDSFPFNSPRSPPA